MMYLSKEATNKDQCLKIQMMLSLDKENSANNSKKIWSSNGFFEDQKGDFSIKKVNFPENTLLYCNQRTISTLKAGDDAIYLDYVILGQSILANKLKENEVMFYVPLYNTENGYFRGVRKWLAYINGPKGIRTKQFLAVVLMWKDRKSCTLVLSIHFQTFFKGLLSKNIQKC